MIDWDKAEVFSLRMGKICSTIPLRGSWEPNNRIALTVASFRLAQEHHGAIHLLISNGKYASANALARPMLEAALRTIWIAEDASDKQISRLLKNGGGLPLLGTLIKSLGARGVLMNSVTQEMLHSFTHGGTIALLNQFIDGERLGRSKAAIVAVVGAGLGSAGCSASRILDRQDLWDQLVVAATAYDFD